MSAIHNIKINNQDVEVVAYGDIYEYVQDADLTHDSAGRKPTGFSRGRNAVPTTR